MKSKADVNYCWEPFVVNEKNYNSFLKAKAKLWGKAPPCKCPRTRAAAPWPLLCTGGPEKAKRMRAQRCFSGPAQEGDVSGLC